MKHGFMDTINAVFTMGYKKFAQTEKGEAGQVERESHDIEGVCIMNSYVRGKQ
jgi:hypothetical protein